MNIFGKDSDLRGCFVKWNLDLQNSKGASMAIYGSDGTSVVLPSNSEEYLPLVITGLDLRMAESVARLRCFRSRTYTYAFGADIGSARVSFSVFLNKGKLKTTGQTGGSKAVSGSSDSFATMLKLYNSGRISESKKQAVVSIGTTGEVLRGQIDSLESGTVDLEHNIQSFNMAMSIIPEPKD